MKEFWFWVAIVSLLIALLGITLMAVLYADKQIRKAEIILQRAEQMEKKRDKKFEPLTE